MKKPEIITRFAVLSAGVVIATLACLAVGTLLERSLQASSAPDATPVEAAREQEQDEMSVLRPDLMQVGEPRP